MKNFILALVAFFPFVVFSQKTFEGRIMYSYSAKEQDSIILVAYFSPGKIRVETNDKSLPDDPNRWDYFLADTEKNSYYFINDSQKTVTKLLLDSARNLGFAPGKFKIPGPKKTVKQFECYGLSTTMTDTIRVLDTFVVDKSTIHLDTFIISESTIDFWYATDLYFPYQLEQGLGYTPILHDKHICLLVEVLIAGDEPFKITIAADTVEQTKLPVSLFQIPTTYTVKYEKASEVFNTKKEFKVTDTKLEVLESIPPPPPPPKDPKSSTSPIKKEKETKPVKG